MKHEAVAVGRIGTPSCSKKADIKSTKEELELKSKYKLGEDSRFICTCLFSKKTDIKRSKEELELESKVRDASPFSQNSDLNTTKRNFWNFDQSNPRESLQLLLNGCLQLTSISRHFWILSNWFINEGACVNAQFPIPETPLHIASRFGNIETALLLLVKGANVNASRKNGYTPLHLSVVKGHYDVSLLLIEQGADVNATTEAGLTPLYLSSEKGHSDISLLLIEQGADVNATSMIGATPLHLSSQEGHRDVSLLLIERGADVCATTCDGRSPLHMCSKNGHKEVVDLLLDQGADINSMTESGLTAIHWACIKGQHDVVMALADRQARTDTIAGNGLTPLSSSCFDGKWDVVHLLIERYGRKIVKHTTCQHTNDITPLTSLVLKKGAPLEILELLVANGASVHDTDPVGRSSLHFACEIASFDTIKFIHSKGVRWDVVDAIGLNPVHCAMKWRDADFQDKIKELLGTERDVAKIGCGSYGKVFKGRWKKNNEWYAIKRLEPRKQFTVENIEQEIGWLRMWSFSPFIISPYWSTSEKQWSRRDDNWNHIFYNVMELCDSDLENWMQTNPCGKRDRREVLQFISDITAGLRFLHFHDGGLIHRDLAPRNILLKRNVVIGSDPPRTVAKISDLGLASEKTSAATGKPFPLHSSGWKQPDPFNPPELPSIATSTPLNYNESVDIFNAGKILHRLLAFKRAQAIQPNKLTEDFKKQQPKDITSFLERMLHKSMEKRPNAYEVERETKKWQADYNNQAEVLLGSS
ncbi:unnamed protein product [Cyprideis torosa]|uniref:Uncharacterized protein n=1 Tax=Cyprideis torosa TaxID=163714 RepID=A0A7R8WEM5_9CRUS|nr:unnamed protein product [Cyprideis torosa]CAG0893090.1 unnamed protein product [Cyprideis torosa]